MSILWQDGFDLYNSTSELSMNYTSPNKGTVTTNGGRFGGGAYSLNSGQPTISLPLAGYTELWLSYGFTFYALDSGDFMVSVFGSSATPNGGIEGCVTYNQTTGTFKVWAGYRNTLLGSLTHFVSSGWHWLDIHYKLHGSTGIVEVWLDDSQIINLTGQNTIYNAGVTTLAFVAPSDSSAGLTPSMTIDDLFITDTTTGRLGDSRIETVVPTSDATPNQATPSTGTNHYAVVNEAQWNTSNHLTMANTSGNKEIFGVGSIASTPTVVHNVKVYMVSQKSDAGSFQLEPLVKSNVTETDGSPTQLLTTSWGTQYAMFPVDPNTAAAWTYTATNAMNIGFKVP